MPSKRTPEERFWSKVDRHGPVPEHFPEIGSCWIWTGAKVTGGYGQVSAHGRSWRTHRVAYILTNGVPPTEKPLVLHHCDNPPCVRPSHLFVGTQQDNVSDSIGKNRQPLRSIPWWVRVSS